MSYSSALFVTFGRSSVRSLCRRFFKRVLHSQQVHSFLVANLRCQILSMKPCIGSQVLLLCNFSVQRSLSILLFISCSVNQVFEVKAGHCFLMALSSFPFFYSFAESLFNAFATAAFFKFVVFSIFEMRYLLAIWKANRPMNSGEGWEAMRRELSVLYSRFCKYLLLEVDLYHNS